jgi:Protein of unknown function (DUF2442)
MPDSSLRAVATGVTFTDERMCVHFQDGRDLRVPMAWFPRLLNATQQQREQWRLMGAGEGMRWDTLDEDISVSRQLDLGCD